MADISQIQFPDGTVYDIKDPVARAAAGDAGAGKIFYGVCSTAATTQTKVVTIEDFELFTGALIAVKFDNVNTATSPMLNISGTGAINMYSVGTTAVLPNAWSAGETLLFVYNGTSYMVADGGIASTSGYGATKLNSSTSSTSTTEAATPSAVKSAYDLANSKQNALTFDTTPTSGSSNPVTSDGIYTNLSSKAPLDSPVLTGAPTAPTASSNTDNDQIATTAFVQDVVSQNSGSWKIQATIPINTSVTASAGNNTQTTALGDIASYVTSEQVSGRLYRWRYVGTLRTTNYGSLQLSNYYFFSAPSATTAYTLIFPMFIAKYISSTSHSYFMASVGAAKYGTSATAVCGYIDYAPTVRLVAESTRSSSSTTYATGTLYLEYMV